MLYIKAMNGKNSKKKNSGKVKATDLMTGYEVRVYRGYKKTAGDQIKEGKMFSQAIKERLAMEEEVKCLETGEMINVSALDLLIDAKLEHDLKNPQDIDLVKWRKAAGEEVVQQDVRVKGANELFGDIVNETK